MLIKLWLFFKVAYKTVSKRERRAEERRGSSSILNTLINQLETLEVWASIVETINLTEGKRMNPRQTRELPSRMLMLDVLNSVFFRNCS